MNQTVYVVMNIDDPYVGGLPAAVFTRFQDAMDYREKNRMDMEIWEFPVDSDTGKCVKETGYDEDRKRRQGQTFMTSASTDRIIK